MDLNQSLVPTEKVIDTELLMANIAALKESLDNRDPDFTKLLRLIHRDLADKPELAHMLEPEQVKVYVNASQRFTQIQIVQENARKKKTANVNDISEDDL